MAEPTLVKLGEVADFLTGFPFKSASYSDDPRDIRLIRGDNIVQGALRWDGVKYWPAELSDDLDKYRLIPGDVVLAMDRPWIEAGLKYAALSDEDCPSLLVQRVTRLRGTEKIDASFLRYVIGGRDFTDYVLAVQTGTAVPHISGGQISAFQFLLPDIVQQRSIGSILGALDERISVNRRMNLTLEAMVRAVFKDCFVDFGPTRAKIEARAPYLVPEIWQLFPNRLDEAGKPEGWTAKPLDQLAEFLNGLALQKYPATAAEWLPVIKIAQLRAGSSTPSDRASMNIPKPYIVDDGDILFSWSGSLLHRVWVAGRGALNQHLFKVTPKGYPKWFVYFWVGHHMPAFQAIAASKATTMGHIQRHHLAAAETFVPDTKLLAAVDGMLNPLFSRMIENDLESRSLGHIRDFLLPRLMTGEIGLGNAESLIEAAA